MGESPGYQVQDLPAWAHSALYRCLAVAHQGVHRLIRGSHAMGLSRQETNDVVAALVNIAGVREGMWDRIPSDGEARTGDRWAPPGSQGVASGSQNRPNSPQLDRTGRGPRSLIWCGVSEIARTSPQWAEVGPAHSQSENTGSNPVGATNVFL